MVGRRTVDDPRAAQSPRRGTSGPDRGESAAATADEEPQTSGGARASVAGKYWVGAGRSAFGASAGQDARTGYHTRTRNGSSATVFDVMRNTALSPASSSKKPLTHTGSGGLA